jgi:hypothetical protein
MLASWRCRVEAAHRSLQRRHLLLQLAELVLLVQRQLGQLCHVSCVVQGRLLRLPLLELLRALISRGSAAAIQSTRLCCHC